jgi:hypothetical protein
MGEWRYSSTNSLTSALGGVSCQLHASAASPQGKSPWRLGGPLSRSGRGSEKFPAPARNRILEPPIVQPVAQRYTDWAITALQSPSWKANSSELPRLSWNPKVHYSVHNSQIVFYGEALCNLSSESPSWRATLCRLFATAYSIYS